MLLLVALLNYLLLSLLAGRSAEAVTLEESIKVNKIPGGRYLIARELFPDGSFAFANIEEAKNASQKEMNVNLTIVGRNSLSNHSTCSFKIRIDEGRTKSLGLNALRRLTEKQLLLMGYEEFENGERHGMLITYDLHNCETIHLYSGSHLPVDNEIITDYNSNTMYIFMRTNNATEDCPSGRTRGTLNPNYDSFDCLNVDLVWPGIQFDFRIDRLFKYIVRGFDTNGTYKLLAYDTETYPDEVTQLFSLPNGIASHSEFASLADGICYLTKPDENDKVHCVIYLGETLNNHTILTYDVPVTLLAASSATNYPDKLVIVLTANVKCEGDDDCDKVTIASIPLSKQATSMNKRVVKLKCADRSKRSIIGVDNISSKASFVVQYTCDNGDDLTFNTITVTAN